MGPKSKRFAPKLGMASSFNILIKFPKWWLKETCNIVNLTVEARSISKKVHVRPTFFAFPAYRTLGTVDKTSWLQNSSKTRSIPSLNYMPSTRQNESKQNQCFTKISGKITRGVKSEAVDVASSKQAHGEARHFCFFSLTFRTRLTPEQVKLSCSTRSIKAIAG